MIPSRITRAQLFTGFFQAGVMGFGGVLPIIRRLLGACALVGMLFL